MSLPDSTLVAWGGKKTRAYIDFRLGVYRLLSRQCLSYSPPQLWEADRIITPPTLYQIV
ncbi:hypothetical protein BDM02DRAFT_3189447 [Thelephora ganbajun]|uniref:Uncharacterized protein n=1 Tax=Thelephora ganbajun TaxID=370292 RepID=A0ACB6Z815_THEGA|nr:hypothetical protein BDM02DRAFT_3189447 [Thelephora ganbajun]